MRSIVEPTPPGAAPIPIPQVQGSGAQSPYEGTAVTVAGVVTGIQRSGANAGFFLQDTTGDGDPATSDGLYVRAAGIDGWLDRVQLGRGATVTGLVVEPGGQTTITANAGGIAAGAAPPSIAPPQAVRLELPVADAARMAYLEAREGMLVELPRALVVGASDGFAQYVAVDADAHGPRRMGSAPDRTGFVHVNGKLGPRAAMSVGDLVTGVRGPLGVSNRTFEVLPIANYRDITPAPAAPLAWGDVDGDDVIGPADVAHVESRVGTAAFGPMDPADLTGDGKVTPSDAKLAALRGARISGAPLVQVATLNAGNFFDNVDAPPPIDDDVPSHNEYQRKLAKLAGTIRDRLGAPDLLALQEVENQRVLDDLVARPELQALGYRSVLLPTVGRRSIHPALLYREGSATVTGVRQLQKAVQDGEEHLVGGVVAGTGAAAGPLFSREPLVVDLTLTADGRTDDVTVIVNHLVSKYSPFGLPTEPLRVDQAKFLRQSVEELTAADPTREVIVLGDLNDTPGSKALKALTGPARTPTLVNAIEELTPPAEAYSFIYQGRSELIDHVLVSPSLEPRIERAGVRHGNADVDHTRAGDSSPARASDHDSAYVWLRLGD